MAERIAPFALRFRESIADGNTTQIGGRYNEKTQTWEWPKNPNDPSLMTTFPLLERPPTICLVRTQIAPGVERPDRVPDD